MGSNDDDDGSAQYRELNRVASSTGIARGLQQVPEIDRLETPSLFKRLEGKFRHRRNEALNAALTEVRNEVGKISSAIHSLSDITLIHHARQLQALAPNPLNSFGLKCFSQSDEDGITLEILRRMDSLSGGVYAEFGVGDGMENNTLILAGLGWKGYWVGGETLKPTIKQSAEARFCYLRNWITLENILGLAAEGLQKVNGKSVDVISLDLDGNDFYFVEALLAGNWTPKLFIVEYNAKFPPPVEFTIPYDPLHQWQNDDYFGASLASFVKLFARFDYKLVCCNSHTGANAFFVRNEYAELFSDVPADIRALYVEPRYRLYRHGHPGAVRTVEVILNRP